MKVSLRTALVAMLLTATVPVAVLMCYHLLDKMRGEQERMRMDLDREAVVLAQVVENEVLASVEALRILGLSESLRVGDVREFERSVAGRGPLRAGWQGSFLTDTRGVVIFDTTGASRRGTLTSVPGFRQMLWDRSPMVSGLLPHKPGSPAGTVIAVPVMIDGELRFGLGVWVPWAAWQLLLKRSTPAEGFSVLFDRDHKVIAHSMDPQANVGRPLPEVPLPGEASYDSTMAVSLAGWGVQRGVAAAPVAAAQVRSITVAWLTAAGCLLLGVTLALLVARRITRPLVKLARQGSSPLELGPVHVREIATLAEALQSARERDQMARDGLRRKADEFEILFNSSPIGLSFAQDRDCVNVLRNAAMGHLFGSPEGEADPAVFHQGEPLDAAQLPLCVAARTGQAVAMMELEFRQPGRPTVHAIANAVPLRDANGRPRGAISAMVDITARMEMESQLHETHEQLRAADRAKDEFLAMLGHELRNPLNAIGASVEVLRRQEARTGMAATAFEILSRQTLHLSHMMGDLLDVTRLISGKVTLAREPIDLARLVRQTLDTLTMSGAADRHELSADVHEAWVDADATRMEQVVANLVGNALKYTPAGRRIGVSLQREDDEAVLRVDDEGDGIPPELLPRVFDLFVQGKRSLDRKGGGLGIGLTLVKRMVDLHGGTVSATSSPAGSRFEVRLPLVPSVVAVAPHDERDSRPGLRVLVVEDNPDALKSVCDVLALDGHAVQGEKDGRAGLAALLEQWPDVAIIDIGLPELDGFQVALQARSRGYAGRMIAATGYGRKQDAQQALKAGFDAHVAKPVDLQALRQLMREGAPAHA